MIDDEKGYKKIMNEKYKIYSKRISDDLEMPQEIIPNISGKYQVDIRENNNQILKLIPYMNFVKI